MKPLKILFFVNGFCPSPEQFEAAQKLAAQVCFRNALAVSADDALELCDGVTGEVPEVYAVKYPTAEKAIEARAKTAKALSEKVGDEAAPKAKAAEKQVAGWKEN